MMVGRMVERIDAGFDDERVRDRLETLPTFVATLKRWTGPFRLN
jgi:hypothetical protein